MAAVTCCCVVPALKSESAVAAFAGGETALDASADPGSAVVLAAGCRSAILAGGRSLEFGLACFAARADNAVFDSSARIAVARWTWAFSERGAGLDGDVGDQVTATASPT